MVLSICWGSNNEDNSPIITLFTYIEVGSELYDLYLLETTSFSSIKLIINTIIWTNIVGIEFSQINILILYACLGQKTRYI